MINEIRIKNFKSVQKLKLDLGRVNVFIGANGCGKSNILEAITFGAAAAANKLDNEFLASRGIRVTNHDMMQSAFGKPKNKEVVDISFLSLSYPVRLSWTIESSKGDFPKWYASVEGDQIVDSGSWKNVADFDANIKELKDKLKKLTPIEYIKDFLIYSPENLALRNFKSEAQIEPLGIHGEGLFYLLTVLNKDKNKHKLEEIKECLKVFDWFEDFQLPQHSGQQSINIRDRFVAADFLEMDQRSANEGFLYLLFYLTLFISGYTPPFFAIDNIDNALNPKLCATLTKVLAKLAKKHNKQVLMTTHNPAVLDGLDLNDDEQRLFVVYRNLDGHTKVRRVEKKEAQKDGTSVKLSEAFMRGYIGGLNKF